jgi:hypothetical protein
MQEFLNFLTSAKDFNIKIVDDEQTMNQLVDFFIDISLENETDADVLEWLFKFDRVIWATIWLTKKDYNEVITQWYGREYIDQDQFISNVITKDKKQMIMLELIKVKDKRNYKTIEELQNELDDAVNNEDYKNAAKLKKQIETRLKRKTKKTKKIKKHESKTNN